MIDIYPQFKPSDEVVKVIGSYDCVHSHKYGSNEVSKQSTISPFYLYHDIFYKHLKGDIIVIGLAYPDFMLHKSMRIKFQGQFYEPYERLYPADHMMYIYKFHIGVHNDIHTHIETHCQPDDIDDTTYIVQHRLTRRLINKRYNYWIFTMFKYDINLLSIWASYYKKLGFDGYTLYFNGPKPDKTNQPYEIQQIYNRYLINIMAWDFDYWLLYDKCKLVTDPIITHPQYKSLPNSMQPDPNGLSLIHGAQALAMNQWVYKYGDLYDFVFFCDLDEILFLGGGNNTINSFVTSHNFSCYIFRMTWANLPDVKKIEFWNNWTTLKSNVMMTENKFLPVPIRTKYMVRPENIKCLSIHMPVFYPCQGQVCRFDVETARFYHFFNWSGKSRTCECTFKDASLQNLTATFR